MPEQYLEAGKITNVHGVMGEVRVQPWADSPDFLCRFHTLYVDEAHWPIRVERARVHKNMVILKLEFSGVWISTRPFSMLIGSLVVIVIQIYQFLLYVGLGEAFGKMNKKAIIALREPSLGPCFGIKGGAAGGGYAQVVPMVYSPRCGKIWF